MPASYFGQLMVLLSCIYNSLSWRVSTSPSHPHHELESDQSVFFFLNFLWLTGPNRTDKTRSGLIRFTGFTFRTHESKPMTWHMLIKHYFFLTLALVTLPEWEFLILNFSSTTSFLKDLTHSPFIFIEGSSAQPPNHHSSTAQPPNQLRRIVGCRLAHRTSLSHITHTVCRRARAPQRLPSSSQHLRVPR